MDITMTRSTQTTSASRVGMPACGHAFDIESGHNEFGHNEFGQVLGGVRGDRAVATKGRLAIVPAYTRGTPAWRPPLS